MRARFAAVATMTILLVTPALGVAAAIIHSDSLAVATLTEDTLRTQASVTTLTRAPALPRWIVSGTPIFDVGAGPDTLHQLYKVGGAIRLADGRVVVANGATELRFYGSDERYLKTVGRAGAGPGEFRRIYLLRHGAGDSILVYDGSRLSRLTIFSSDGKVGRSVHARRWGEVIVEHDAAGGFIAGPVTVSFAQAAPNVQRTTYTVEGITPEGTVARMFTTNLTKDSYVTHQPPRIVAPMPFAAPVSVAASHDRVYIAARPAYYIAVFTHDGSPLPPIQRAGSPHSVTDDDLDAYIENHMMRLTSQHARDVTRRRIERMPRADVVPEIARLLTDEAGDLWVQDFAISERAPSTWTVYSASDRPVATVTLPSKLTVQQIGGDWLLGIQPDTNDVQHVVEYQLAK